MTKDIEKNTTLNCTKLFLALCNSERNETNETCLEKAEIDAKRLKMCDSEHSEAFIEVFSRNSYQQIKLVNLFYIF